jgi:isopentenyldiphosphate isomerase
VSDAHQEALNVYDAHGRVIGVRRRAEAKREGLIVGAVNALIVNSEQKVLLQLRPLDKENGGCWDKSVGGHVAAGEDFDQTIVRETGEELFDDPGSDAVRLARDSADFRALVGAGAAGRGVILERASVQLGLRDVRRQPGGGWQNVVYHVAVYLGRSDLPLDSFRPQPSEIVSLRHATAAELDELLLEGRLAPNMAFLWLAKARDLLGLARAEDQGGDGQEQGLG